MEATKERIEKEQNKKKIVQSSLAANESGKSNDTARAIVRESIVEGGDGDGDGGSKRNGGAHKPEDILAFSRTVRNIDSSLEFKLPENVLTDQVTAWMEDEFLVVFVAKDGSHSSPPSLPPENRNVRVVEIIGDDE
ncbi:unnamed protein product [Arabis nemorensis]|uniref:Uncharacterized protein n=1 Tax=Arabis nemorensis TaxID=586526 RepID=A0A565BDE0_9BRAS|nr:unnamed protein product [Arabis nemorensis]